MSRAGDAAEITARRLLAHHLTGEPFASPLEAVRWLGAVQSQDYGAAKWAVAQRCRNTADAELDRLFDQGRILRTHGLRPTWHFILPEDVGWILDLTGPRVLSGAAGRYRELGIDARTMERACSTFVAALSGGRHLTRPELGQQLQAAGISAEGQRLAYLILAAELQGLVVSGPRRGRQFTYALFAERVAGARRLAGEAALGELARRYFRSRGPAQLRDFAWWSGLTLAQARSGIAAAAPDLERREIRGAEHWADARAPSPAGAARLAHLLPNFDEYTVSYSDRAVLVEGRSFDPRLFSFGSILSNVVTIAGRVRGAWRRTGISRSTVLEIRTLERMTAVERRAVAVAADAYASFLGRPLRMEWAPGP